MRSNAGFRINQGAVLAGLAALLTFTLGANAQSFEDGGPALTLKGPEEPMATRFIERVPEVGRLATAEEIRFAGFDPATSPSVLRLSLNECVQLAVENNFDLVNARRDVEISRSRLRESEAFFIPFVELIGEATYSETRFQTNNDPLDDDLEDRTRITQNTQEGRAVVTKNLATGGTVSAAAGSQRTRDGAGIAPDGGNIVYDTDAEVRFNQPLLRGAGFAVATADLRQARLDQINQEIAYRLQVRDTVVQVVEQYFLLLQAALELRVSRDAIAEKLRFLEETRIKYQQGRVAESEILRAELQYLQEEETAVRNRRVLVDRRERLALILGLSPGANLAIQDVSVLLAERGRYLIPPVDEAIDLGLSSRLELLQSELNYERRAIDLQVARNNVYPNLDFTSGYSTQDADDSLGGSTDLEDNAWDVGLELRIPIPNIGRREQRRRAGLNLDKARTDWEDLERQVTQQVTASHRGVQSAESALAILAKTVEQARKNLELINGSFEVGYSTITEVRLAQDDLFEAQTRYNTTLLNYQIAIAQFYVAVGQDLY